MRSRVLRHVAEGLLLVTIVIAPWHYGGADDLTRYSLFAAVCGAASLWHAHRAWSGLGAPALTLPALALPALALVQVLLGRSVAPVWTLESALLLTGGAGVVLFWSDEGRDRKAALRLASSVLAACVAQSVFGAGQWSIAPDRIYGHFATMPFGSFMSHNHFAGLVGMGAVLAAGMALGHARRAGGLTAGALGLGGLSLGLTAAHLASRSRGGVVALAGGLALLAALWTWASGRRKASLAWTGLLAALALAFGFMAIPEASRARLASLLRGPTDASGAMRLDLAATTLRLAASRPLLGWGFGSYADALPPFKRGHGELRPVHAESDVLEGLAEGGLAGALAVFFLARAVWRGVRERATKGRDPFRKGLALGAAAAVGAVALHSMIDFNLRIPSNALTFASLLGLAAAPRSEPGAAGGRRVSLILACVFALCAAACAWRGAEAAALDQALRIADPNRRLAALDRVVRWHPYDDEARRSRGLAWRDLAWQPPVWLKARLARAEADFRSGLRSRPRAAMLWRDLGWILYFEGDVTGATAAFQRAAELDPNDLDLGLAYADFMARTGDLKGALVETRRHRYTSRYWTLEQAAVFATRWTRDPELLALLTDGSEEERSLVIHVARRP